jgi:TetR/AcrR family transcriptional regulator, regulator of autoinduction and epiphytic fitness
MALPQGSSGRAAPLFRLAEDSRGEHEVTSPHAISRSNRAIGTDGATALSDGRRERGRRTRDQVISALITLIEEGDLRPTAQHVANRAGVSLRTVYHHFSDISALRVEALAAAWDRHASALDPVDPARPLEERVRHVVKELRRLFEAVAPFCRAESLVTDATANELGYSRAAVRQFIAGAFERELSSAGIAAPVLLDAVDTALCWQNWEYMRSDLGRSASKASQTVEMVVRSLFVAESLT